MTIIDSIRQRVRIENAMVKLVLIIKNQEETIEGALRNIYIGSALKKVLPVNRMIIVDMGSEDKTMDILIKMKKDYDFFEILNDNEKETIFNGFNLEK
jgi:hypothetical protein